MSLSSHLWTILVIAQNVEKSVELPWGHGQHSFHSYSSFSLTSLISSPLKTFIFSLYSSFSIVYTHYIYFIFLYISVYFRWLSSFQFKCVKPHFLTCNCPFSLPAPSGFLSPFLLTHAHILFYLPSPPLLSGLTEPSSLRFFTLSVRILITFLK